MTGRLDVKKLHRERLLTTIAPGDLVGELALLDLLPRSANVVAASNPLALKIDRMLLGESGDPLTLRL